MMSNIFSDEIGRLFKSLWNKNIVHK